MDRNLGGYPRTEDLSITALFIKELNPPPYKIGELAYTFDMSKLVNLIHSILPSEQRLLELVSGPPTDDETKADPNANKKAEAKAVSKTNANTRKQHAGKTLPAPIRTTDKGGLTLSKTAPKDAANPSSGEASLFRGRLRGELVHDMAIMGRELCIHLTHARSANNDTEYEVWQIQEPVFTPLEKERRELRAKHDAERLPELSEAEATPEERKSRKEEIMQQDKVLDKKERELEEFFRPALMPIHGQVLRKRSKFLSDHRQERKKVYDRYKEAIQDSDSFDDVIYEEWRDEAKAVAWTLLDMVDKAADLRLDEHGRSPYYKHHVPRSKK